MIRRIIDAIMERYGVTEEQVDKVKSMIDMVEFKEEDEKRFAIIRPGKGIEIKIEQPNNPEMAGAQTEALKRKTEELERVLSRSRTFSVR